MISIDKFLLKCIIILDYLYLLRRRCDGASNWLRREVRLRNSLLALEYGHFLHVSPECNFFASPVAEERINENETNKNQSARSSKVANP